MRVFDIILIDCVNPCYLHTLGELFKVGEQFPMRITVNSTTRNVPLSTLEMLLERWMIGVRVVGMDGETIGINDFQLTLSR